MKIPISNLIALSLLILGAPLQADIVYTHVNTGIATTYTGTTVTVGDGSLNLFFGGAGLANDANFQPFRSGTGTVDGMNTVLNISDGTVVNGSSGGLAVNYGGSTDHLGGRFGTGSDGYVGFKLDGVNYGWMRVQLTYGISGGVVRDWAYDDSGAAIKTGWIKTDVVSGSAQTVTFNPAIGESFTLSSSTPLANASGYTNSLVKIGEGTSILNGANTYTGSTTVSAGKLLVNGSTAGGGALTVAAGTLTATPIATLGGSGSIGGSVVLTAESETGFKNGGILAPTAAASGTNLSVAGTTTFGAGSIFEWGMNATAPEIDPGVGLNFGDYGQLAGADTIGGSDAIFRIALGDGNAFSDAYWNTNKTWDNVFSGSGASNDLTSIFSSIGGEGINYDVDLGRGNVATRGYFTFNGTGTLNWSAVPEPSISMLAGLMIIASLLRRRRD